MQYFFNIKIQLTLEIQSTADSRTKIYGIHLNWAVEAQKPLIFIFIFCMNMCTCQKKLSPISSASLSEIYSWTPGLEKILYSKTKSGPVVTLNLKSKKHSSYFIRDLIARSQLPSISSQETNAILLCSLALDLSASYLSSFPFRCIVQHNGNLKIILYPNECWFLSYSVNIQAIWIGFYFQGL